MNKIPMCLMMIMIISGWSCDANKDCCVPEIYSEGNIEGSWLLFEEGYSTGAGYTTKGVDSSPAQIMNFEADNRFSSSVKGLESYQYYQVRKDSLLSSEILILYKENPGDPPQDVTDQEPRYRINYDKNGNLKLSFMYCIEGCHMKLKPVTDSPAK